MNIYKTIWHGSLWAVAMRWSMRLVGVLSIVVLVRLLQPEDFGILAMASLLIGAFANFSGLGVGALLIREADVEKDDIDTAWTIRIIQGVMLAGAVAAFAYPTSVYFKEPRLTDVIYVCAFALLIGAFENIGMVLVRKELDFATDFRYQLIMKFVAAVATIALAFWLRSYWALALSRPISAVIGVAMSFAMHPYRPSFSMKRSRRFYRFSLSVVASNTARFIGSKADVFLVGTSSTTAQMGVYNIAAETSSIPATEVTMSVGRAMLPGLSKLKNTGGGSAQLNAMFLQIIGSVALLCIPMGLGLWVVAPDFVRVVFGERWIDATDLMGYLAIYGTLTSLVTIMLGHVLIVTGHEYRQAGAWWIRAALLMVCALAGMQFGVRGIAIGATISGAIMFLVAIVILQQTLGCRLGDFVRIYWRPTFASLVMVAIVYCGAQMMAVPQTVRLILSVLLGVVAYVATLILAWFASGRPVGAESAVLALVLRRSVLPGK